MDLDTEMDFSKGLAREAGQEILRLAMQEPTVGYKDDGEVVTSVDTVVDQHIRRDIKKRNGQDGLLTEEAKDNLSRLGKGRVWIVDSIDGTIEFEKYLSDPENHPYFAVHIGLAVNGVTQLGVVYAPVLDKLFFAQRGAGAYLTENGKTTQLRVSTVASLENAMIGVKASRREEAEALQGNGIRVIESLGIKVCYVAAGYLDCFMTKTTKSKEWDTCAPSVILEEAGGKITDIHGNLITYNKRDVYNRQGVIATNGLLHKKVQDLLR